MQKTTNDYSERVKAEVAKYARQFNGRLAQEVPSIWDAVERDFADTIQKQTGVRNLYEYVLRDVKNKGKQKVHILGLGSGACGNELDGITPLLQSIGVEVHLTCLDINEEIIEQAKGEAVKRGVNFSGIAADVNQVQLDPCTYDVVVAYAALHHFIELDHITREVNSALTDDGLFVTVDIPTRNGYKMWEETLQIVRSLWEVIPPQFKIDHSGFAEPTFVEEYLNIDFSVGCFECINSEAILPALKNNLITEEYVPAMSICRRFFDTKYGPNYNLNEELDKSIFDFIMKLDEYYLESGLLQPETFFGAYRKQLLH